MYLDFLIYRPSPNICAASGNSTNGDPCGKCLHRGHKCSCILHYPRKTKFICKILQVSYQSMVVPGQLASGKHSFLPPCSSFTMRAQCLKYSAPWIQVPHAATLWPSLDHPPRHAPLAPQTLCPLGRAQLQKGPSRAYWSTRPRKEIPLALT